MASMKTFLPDIETIERKWWILDAQDQVLGRLASRVASLLMGKVKPSYTDFLDTGDFVIVVNVDKVRLTGKKWQEKAYYHHTGYPGGIKRMTAKELSSKHPERLIEYAVQGMLPKNKLGSRMIKRLKVYAGPDHPHQAQRPEKLVS